VQSSLTDTTAELALGAERLHEALGLISDPAGFYRNAPDEVRGKVNSAFTTDSRLTTIP